MSMAKNILTMAAAAVEAATAAPKSPKPPRRAGSSVATFPEPVAAAKPTGRKAKAETAALTQVKPTKVTQPKQAEEVVAPAPTKPTRGKKAPALVEQAPAVPVRGLGIGALARKLLLEHPDWTHAQVAELVNATIPGAQSSEKSMRWYSCQMKKKGIQGAERVRQREP